MTCHYKSTVLGQALVTRLLNPEMKISISSCRTVPSTPSVHPYQNSPAWSYELRQCGYHALQHGAHLLTYVRWRYHLHYADGI